MREKLTHFFKAIFVRFTFAFILFGMLPFIVMTYLIFEEIPQELEGYMLSNYEQVLDYTSRNIELKISEYDQILQLVYTFRSGEFENLAQILGYERAINLTPEKQMDLVEGFLISTIYSERNIESVILLDSQQDVISFASKDTHMLMETFDLTQYPYFYNIEANKKDLTIIPTHNQNYLYPSDKTVMTFARNYLDIDKIPQEEQIITTLFMDVNVAFIEKILDQASLRENGVVYILDASGYTIYNSGKDEKELVKEAIYQKVQDESGYMIHNNGYIFYKAMESYDWTIYYEVDQSSVLKKIDDLKGFSSLLMIVVGIALICTAIIFSRQLSMPIKKVTHQMKRLEGGDFTAKIHVENLTNEMEQLVDAYNKMTDQLQDYINKAYVAQVKQKEAELAMIKAQIRPHYLYNTLEIIRMSALEEEADETQEMIYSLSQQLRYTIGATNEKVELGAEIEMIENYFKIINVRYGGYITLEIDIPKEFYRYKILKLLIQPLVENAVIHGLKPKRGRGKVKVSATMENDSLIIQVIDDGIGIREEDLNHLRLLLKGIRFDSDAQGTKESMGLKSVYDRIQLTYGESYGINITSKFNAGTLMEINIPIESEVINND